MIVVIALPATNAEYIGHLISCIKCAYLVQYYMDNSDEVYFISDEWTTNYLKGAGYSVLTDGVSEVDVVLFSHFRSLKEFLGLADQLSKFRAGSRWVYEDGDLCLNMLGNAQVHEMVDEIHIRSLSMVTPSIEPAMSKIVVTSNYCNYDMKRYAKYWDGQVSSSLLSVGTTNPLDSRYEHRRSTIQYLIDNVSQYKLVSSDWEGDESVLLSRFVDLNADAPILSSYVGIMDDPKRSVRYDHTTPKTFQLISHHPVVIARKFNTLIELGYPEVLMYDDVSEVPAIMDYIINNYHALVRELDVVRDNIMKSHSSIGVLNVK